MAALPSTPQTLHGGCFCKAIRYTISIPALEERPGIQERFLKNLIVPLSEATARLPFFSFDHCHSCRHMNGSLFMNWIIIPQSWVSFTLQPLSARGPTQPEQEEKINPPTLEFLFPGAKTEKEPEKESLDQKTHLRYFESSQHANRTFCGRCGTGISFLYSGPDDEMAAADAWGPHCDVNFATLDDECLEMDGVRPHKHVHYAEAVSWVSAVMEKGDKGVVG